MNLDRMARWWRLAPWSSNSLMRRGDRITSLATVMAVGFVLLLVPVAAVFGSSTYSRLGVESSLDSAHVHPAQATVVDVPTPVTAPTEFAVVMQSYAEARWRVADVEHSGRVQVPIDAVQGQTIPIWVDDEGSRTRPPRKGIENAALGVCAALGIWAAGSVVAACGVGVVRLTAARANSKRWTRELRRLERSTG